MGISREQALDCFRSDDLLGIGMEADAVRRRLHPEGVVTYAIEACIDCANIPGANSSAAHDAILNTIAQAVEAGTGSIHLHGCNDAQGTEHLLKEIRHRFPELWIEALPPTQIRSFATALGLSLRETIARLMDAGLNSIASEGILLTSIPTSSGTSNLADWIDVHRAAHALGMRTVAGMIFGAGETPIQRVEFLQTIRQLQQETSGFAAFAPLAAEAPGGRELDGVTAVERLKTVAIARMFLDTIVNLQASATPQSLKVLQTCLRFGANDVGPVDLQFGREEDIRRILRDAGFRPAPRQMGYRALSLS